VSFFANTAPQDQVPKKLANISDDAINSNQQAVPVPYLAGRVYVAGNYITPAYNAKAKPISTQTQKGEDGQVSSYKYFADFALMFCMGGRNPVNAVYKVILDSDIIWSGNIQRGQAHKEVITIDKRGTIHLYWGDESQPIDNVLLNVRQAPIGGGNKQDKTTYPPNDGANKTGNPQFAAGDTDPFSGHYDQHPAYRGQCYAVFKDWKLGRNRTSVPNILLELKRGCPFVGGTFKASDDKGVNPAAVLYDWLTDTRFGMALPETQLVTASFTNLFNALEAQGARLSVLITQQDDFRQAVANLLEYYDGWIRNNGGQIEVGYWVHGAVTSVGTLTDDDLLGDPELEPTGWGPTINELSVVYADRDHHFNTYAQSYRDPNNFRITGSPRPSVLQRPWITDANLAKRYAREYGAILALPTAKGDLHVRREWLDNNNALPGSVFFYESAFYGLQWYMRLLEVEHAADNSAVATMTVEWERSVWPSLYIPPGFQGPGGFVMGPRAIWNSRVVEVPYTLLDKKFLTQIACLSIKGNVEVIGYRIWASFDNGATYQCLSSSNNFGAFGVLAADTGTASTSAWWNIYGPNHDEIVLPQTVAQVNDDTLLCFVGNEICSVGAIAAYANGYKQIYWARARLGTSVGSYPAGTVAYYIPRADLHILDNVGFEPGATVLFKIQPFTVDADYDLSTVTPISYTVTGFNPVPAPTLSPAGGPFVGVVAPLPSQPPAGFDLRFTADGTEVTRSSVLWARSGSTYIAGYLNKSAVIRVRFTAANGRSSPEAIFTYTKVQQIPGQPAPTQQAGAPSRSFSGSKGHTAGNLTLTAVTAGSVIHYSLNGGVTQNYSVPVHLNCTAGGDTLEYWASAAGMDDSNHAWFDNTKVQGSGGGNPGGGGGGLPP